MDECNHRPATGRSGLVRQVEVERLERRYLGVADVEMLVPDVVDVGKWQDVDALWAIGAVRIWNSDLLLRGVLLLIHLEAHRCEHGFQLVRRRRR